MVAVETEQGLRDALQQGERHIVVAADINATAARLPEVRDATVSIRGTCQSTGGGPRRCKVDVMGSFVRLGTAEQELLLTGLLLRAHGGGAVLELHEGRLWAQDVGLLHVGGGQDARGLEARNGATAQLSGVTIEGFAVAGGVGAGALVTGPAHLGLSNCRFVHNTAAGGAALTLRPDSNRAARVYAQDLVAPARLNNATAPRGAGDAAILLAAAPAVLYLDAPRRHPVRGVTGAIVQARPLANARAAHFLAPHRPRFQAIADEAPGARPIELFAWTEAAPPGTQAGSSRLEVAVGAAVAALVVLAAAALCALLVARRRRAARGGCSADALRTPRTEGGRVGDAPSSARNEAATAHSADSVEGGAAKAGSPLIGAVAEPATPEPTWPQPARTLSGGSATTSTYPELPAPPILPEGQAGAAGGSTAGGSGLITTLLGSTLDATAAARAAPASSRAALEAAAGGGAGAGQVEAALDALALPRAPLFLRHYRILPAAQRRRGGQGVVQFCESAADGEPYAIKFFTNRGAFEREAALYARDELRSMMPAVRCVCSNADGAVMTPAGWVFPPFIVVEKGESLDEWALRIVPDFPTVLTVLCHVAARLQQLHHAGLAHRDIKPANILWRPRHFSWTILDYGCAAEIGVATPLALSVKYAAPEAVRAWRAGERSIVSDAAADMWALGVVAYELLLGRPAFPRGTPLEAVRAQICGAAPLPWESAQGRKRHIPELRFLRRSVMSLLERDPLKRPTSQQLLQSWNNLFDSHSTEQQRRDAARVAGAV